MADRDPFQDISADFVHVGRTQALSGRQVLLVPGSDVAALPLELPAGLRGQTREQVARRQLGDQLGPAADRTEMRPFACDRDEGTWSRVLVADRALVDYWRSEAGGKGRAVLPDYLALPTSDEIWTVVRGPHGLAVRLGPTDGFGGPENIAIAQLDRELRHAQQVPKAMLLLGLNLDPVAALADARDIPTLTDPFEADRYGLSVPQVLGHGEVEMDLRRDPQMARARLSRTIQIWRWPTLLALTAAVIWAVSQVLVIDRVRQETAQIDADTEALVRADFVPVGPILDARVQVSQVLDGLRAEVTNTRDRVEPLVLFNRAALAVTSAGARTELVNYAGDARFSLVVTVDDFAAAERLSAALVAAGLGVEVVDTRVREGQPGVRSELRLSPGPEAQK